MRLLFTKKKILVAATAAVVVVGASLFFARACCAESAPKDAKAAAPAGLAVNELGWAERCPTQKDPKQPKLPCEVFQRLEVKDSHARIAEFAVGFPENKEVARGGVILPLGILLDPGVVMKIDDEKPFTFKAQYCTNGGCVAFINLDKAVLEQMKKGTDIHFMFKTMEGQNVDIGMKLTGFGKVLKQIQG